MERNSVNDKRAERYVVAVFVILFVTLAAPNIIFNYEYVFRWWLEGNHHTMRYERIRVGSPSVAKSTNAGLLFVTIYFENTGTVSSGIDAVLLNGVLYNESGWTGTLKPVVFGDLEPGTVIEAGESYVGLIIFSEDCRDPSGNKLIAEDDYSLKVTIDTTGGKDYNTTVVLP